MSNNNVAIRSAILTKLQGVGRLSAVYDHEVATPENGKYPFATVVLESGEAEFGDTIRNIRTHRFLINVYQERTVTGFGNEKAEDIILSICDEIETAFDMDTTLSGTVKWVKPLQFNATYVDREIGDTRVAQYIVDAVTVVPSQT